MRTFFYIIFLLPLVCFADDFTPSQQKTLDSLYSILNNPNSHDTSLLRMRKEIGNMESTYRVSYWDSIAQDGLQLIQKTDNHEIRKSVHHVLASTYNNLGFIQCNQGSVKDGIDNFKKAIEYYKKLEKDDGVATTYSNIGYVSEYHLGDWKLAMDNYTRSLNIRKEMKDTIGICRMLNMIGVSQYDRGNTSVALDYYDEILELSVASGDSVAIGECYNNIGIVHLKKGRIELALEHFHDAMNIQKKQGDLEGVAAALNNIGYIYKNQGDTNNAINYFEQSKKVFEQINDRKGLVSALVNIAYILNEKGDKDRALDLYMEGLQISKDIGNHKEVAETYNKIGDLYSSGSKTDLNKALHYYQLSLEIMERIESKQGICVALNGIVKVGLEQKVGLSELKKWIDKSLKLAKEIAYPEIIKESARLSSIVYENSGNGMKALQFHKLYVSMRDSIKNEETQKAAVRQQAKYEYDQQKILDDAENEKKLAVEREEKEQQKVITYATIGGLALVLIFLVIIFNRLQVTRKQKEIIAETNEELNQTNEEIAAQRDEIENQKNKVEEAHQEIKDSIVYAKRIQNAILPANKLVEISLPDSFVYYQPKDVVAGDFYWLEVVGSTVLFAAADCTGHGVPGAMVSVVCHNAMNRAVREFGLTEPGLILDKTREIVVEEFEKSEDDVKDGMDIALCSLSGNKLQYAGAHNPLWIVRDDEILETKADQSAGSDQHNYEIIEIKADKQPIGKFDNPAPYKTHTIELQKEDSIYIFSDGFPDQFGGVNDKKFGSKRLKDLLISFQDKSMENQKEVLESTLLNWMRESGSEQLDDICIMGVKI